jgi:hypothetical protein
MSLSNILTSKLFENDGKTLGCTLPYNRMGKAKFYGFRIQQLLQRRYNNTFFLALHTTHENHRSNCPDTQKETVTTSENLLPYEQ